MWNHLVVLYPNTAKVSLACVPRCCSIVRCFPQGFTPRGIFLSEVLRPPYYDFSPQCFVGFCHGTLRQTLMQVKKIILAWVLESGFAVSIVGSLLRHWNTRWSLISGRDQDLAKLLDCVSYDPFYNHYCTSNVPRPASGSQVTCSSHHRIIQPRT
ncbi:hypothetical protein BJV78DRAFT_541635 [Lactifluus subvellereus]|nr:hypothetical protein BJV78DRAFT_541635 [Lactifluus subvellereus]